MHNIFLHYTFLKSTNDESNVIIMLGENIA